MQYAQKILEHGSTPLARSDNFFQKFLHHRGVSTFPVAVLFSAACGMIIFYSLFSKIRIGPFYLLEALFLLWFFAAVAVGQVRFGFFFDAFRGDLRPVFLFAAWGFLRLAIDFTTQVTGAVLPSTTEILQNCVLFVFPLLWTTAGYWVTRTQPHERIKTFAYFVLAIAVLRSSVNYYSSNFSLGPLAGIVAALGFYNLALPRKSNRAKAFENWALALLCAVVAFFPFWRMWFSGNMPRTALVQLFAPFVLLPVLTQNVRNWRVWASQSVPLVLFLIGILFATGVNFFSQDKYSFSISAKRQIYGNLQHGEDMVHDGHLDRVYDSGSFLKLRDRRFWWGTALEQWKRRPFVGEGLFINVPEYARPGVRNDGIFENAPDYQSVLQGKPFRGPHNSYLTILTRLGLVGLCFFAFILFRMLQKTHLVFSDPRDLIVKMTFFFIPLNGLFYALFNVGLETPYNCVLLWLFMGMLYGYKSLK